MTVVDSGASSDVVELGAIGLLDFLDQDLRATCVIDLDKVTPHIIFRNGRFTEDYDFSTQKNDADPNEDESRDEKLYFRSWALSRLTQDSRLTINCYGLSWVATIVRQRFKVIQATTKTVHTDDSDSDASSHTELNHAGILRKLPKGSAEAHHEWLRNMMQKSSPHDWTAPIRPRKLSDHLMFLRNWDWASTPLGGLDTWSPQLRLMVNLITIDPNPAVLFWGHKLAGVYNESYVPLLHDKHPKSLGEPYHKTWSELYRQEDVAPVVDGIWKKNLNGEPIMWLRRTFFLRNGNRLQEHIFNVSFLPILDEDGRTIGFYEPFKEVTHDACAERRSESIRSISSLVAGEDDVATFYQKVIAALEPNANDIPFAMLYSLKSSNIDWKRPIMLNRAVENGQAKLESYLGIRVNDDGEPAVQELLLNDGPFLDTFARVCQTGHMETVDLEARSGIAESVVEDPAIRGFGDQCRLAALLPIESITGQGVNAVLIVGTNTRRPYDADMEAFMRDLGRSVSSMLASLILMNKQKKKVGEALQAEKRAVSMLEASPVGACLLTRSGVILYANTSWKTITDYKYTDGPYDWLQMMTDESMKKAQRAFTNVVERGQEVTLELALKKPWRYADPATGEQVEDRTYILASALLQQLGDEDYVISVVTDISYQKWMESLHDQRRKEALEMKRAQENFMDMTSHEMRNPLSAIFQCADSIVNSLSALQQNITGLSNPDLSSSRVFGQSRRSSLAPGVSVELVEAVSQAIENASTITLCAQHQRRIVDDVLVLSKVDAKLIEIHPVEVQPRTLACNAIKMFAAELAANKTNMTLEIEQSFKDLRIDWVKLDPGRLLQILINLCTNAIKFTMDAHIRKITIQVGASTIVPTHTSRGVRFLHGISEESYDDPTGKSEWGEGEVVYLSFQVTDTGQGMTSEEMHLLFQRFKQASPRTHTQYGGSGLGLFIARLLSRLQGGEIGVISKAGRGTTFAFYVKVRRVPTPHGADLHKVVPQLNMPVGSHSDESPSVMSDDAMRLTEPSDVSILIVEDNLVNQRVLKQQLVREGFAVSVANHGVECLDLIKKSEHWDAEKEDNGVAADKDMLKLSVVLMDVEMPVMDGNEATRRIRELENSGHLLRHIPIIAITANARLEQISTARESGMDDVVSKPFRIPELLAKLETFVGPINKKR